MTDQRDDKPHVLPCIFCHGLGHITVSHETTELAERAVEAQRNDKRTMDEKIRDGVSFIMGPGGDEGTRLTPSADVGSDYVPWDLETAKQEIKDLFARNNGGTLQEADIIDGALDEILTPPPANQSHAVNSEVATAVTAALVMAQSVLRRWADLYGHLQNECGEVVSRKLDYNLPPGDHVRTLEAIAEAIPLSKVAATPSATRESKT